MGRIHFRFGSILGESGLINFKCGRINVKSRRINFESGRINVISGLMIPKSVLILCEIFIIHHPGAEMAPG